MTQVKNLKDLPTVSTLGNTRSLIVTDNPSGKGYRMPKDNLMNKLKAISSVAINGGTNIRI